MLRYDHANQESSRKEPDQEVKKQQNMGINRILLTMQEPEDIDHRPSYASSRSLT